MTQAEVQYLGIQIVLMGINDLSRRLGVAFVGEHLALRADSIITLPIELITNCFTRSLAATPRPTPAPQPAHPAADPTPMPLEPCL